MTTVNVIAELISNGPVAIDGGLASELELAGHDLSDNLWSARLLKDDPGAIQDVHSAYAHAGARVLTSASYQASRMGFRDVGLSQAEADRLLAESVRIARAATTGRQLVAASVGPYGAVLGGGQEYVGNYGLTLRELIDFHAERLDHLVPAGPDLLACETVPDVLEVEALCSAIAELSDIPAWISVSCNSPNTTCAGQPVGDVARAVAGHPQIAAIGINCTKPEYVSSLLRQLRDVDDEIPFVVYPNAGRTWDGNAREWVGEGAVVLNDGAVTEWVDLGARLIGGCCGLGPHAIEHLSHQLATAT